MTPPFLKKLRRNWQIKVYMLLLAILLWIFVVTNQVYETVIDIPLDIIKVKPNKVLVSDVPAKATVRFSGVGKDLLILEYIQQAKLELDVHTINYFYDYPLKPEYVVVPSGLDVQPLYVIWPDTVKIRLEDRLVTRLPVIPQVKAVPKDGYMISGTVTAVPESVTVSGPQSAVRRLRGVRTEEATFNNLERPAEESVKLVSPDPKVSLVPTEVQVHIPVDMIAERSIQRVPLGTRRVPLGRLALLEPSTIDVHLRGPAERLAGLTADSLKAFVDLSQWSPDVREYPPSVTPPPGIDVMNTNPDLVRVRIEHEEGMSEGDEAPRN